MKINSLLKDVNVLYAPNLKNIEISNICINTNNVEQNSLFICLKGQKTNGHNLKEIAKANGAVAFVVEEFDNLFDGVQILVKSSRQALSKIAKNFYKPKKNLKIIGITGTNGKTTTTFMLANILKSAGKNVGVIGTEGIYFNHIKIEQNMTTPDPIELFKYLSLMSKQKVQYVVMEVSAHAIYYNKIDAIKFYAKGLTNITEDHLDFFETMENYSKEKLRFMLSDNCIKVVNYDDEYASKLQDNKKLYFFSREQECDIFCYEASKDYSTFSLTIFDKNITLKTNLIGSYNVENAMLAASLAKIMGIDDKHIKMGIESFKSVEGRLNIYKNGSKMAIIDFAHTPDAMQKVLATINEFKQNRLIAVFGCGGNRDGEKRSIMGEISARLCDMVYITNDNPRHEDPKQIAQAIASRIKTDNYEIILDRRQAIETAIKSMQDGDIVALLGKGAEDYIEIMETKHPYSDKEEVEKWGFKG